MIAENIDTASTHSDSADEQILSLLRDKHPAAPKRLLDCYGERVYATARRILASDEDAKDAMLETFITILRKWPTFRDQSRFSSWIYTIARNQAIMMLRKRRRFQHVISLDLPAFPFSNADDSPRTLIENTPVESPAPDQHLAQGELRAQIHQAIESLDPQYRHVYRMKEVEGKSLKEIAAATALSEPAVKSRVHRAREQLRCILAPVFYN